MGELPAGWCASCGAWAPDGDCAWCDRSEPSARLAVLLVLAAVLAGVLIGVAAWLPPG